MISDVNRNQFQIFYDKVVKLGYATAEGTGNNAGQQYFANNDYKFNIMRKINITKMLAKTYGYNDSTTDPSSGRALFIWFFYANADGGAQNTNYKQANIAINVDYTFDE